MEIPIPQWQRCALAGQLLRGGGSLLCGGAAAPDDKWFKKRAENANNRSRYKRKSKGDPITYQEVAKLWASCNGKCTHCGIALKLTGWTDTSATLDRIDGSRNRSYRGNARFVCRGCNNEKAGWELAREYKKRLDVYEGGG